MPKALNNIRISNDIYKDSNQCQNINWIEQYVYIISRKSLASKTLNRASIKWILSDYLFFMKTTNFLWFTILKLQCIFYHPRTSGLNSSIVLITSLVDFGISGWGWELFCREPHLVIFILEWKITFTKWF